MLKKISITALLLVTSALFSQEAVSSFPLDLNKNGSVFQIVNDSTKIVTLFFNDKTDIKSIRVNEKMEIIDSLSVKRLNDSEYPNMLGYIENKSNQILFWSSTNRKKILFQPINYNKDEKLSIQTYSIPLKDERYLRNFSIKDKFYILTILKNSNILKFYVFNNDGRLEEKTVNLSEINFYHRSNLYDIFEENLLPFEAPFSLQKISSKNPISLTESAQKRKLYLNENQMIIAFDTDVSYTQLITIDLNKFTATNKYIKKTLDKSQDILGLNTNSILMDKKLYQIVSSSSKFTVSIKDLEGNLIKEYVASGDAQISFKNTAIIQENTGVSNSRVLEKTPQFIRKLNNLNSGISCYNLNGTNLITIGSVSEQQQSGSAMVIGGMFGLVGSLIATAVSNPTMESFNAYANRKVVYINCLFDKEGNHIDGEIKPLAFDKIRIFADKDKNISNQTLFKQNNSYILAYFDNKLKNYNFVKFED